TPPCRAPARPAPGAGHGVHDVLVARAAAEVAREHGPDGLGVVRAPSAYPGPGRHEHARRADAALRSALGEEGLLQDVEPVRGAERFDRLHAAARGVGDGY